MNSRVVNLFAHLPSLSPKKYSLTMAVLFFFGLSLAGFAQLTTRSATSQAFTIAPNVETPVVIQTMPDAECDLRSEGINDNKLRLYANVEGYVRFHVNARQESEDGQDFQLDCQAGGQVTRFPLHLRASPSPRADMPAPLAEMPVPKGARILPGLTEAAAQQLSDHDLIAQGYMPRPDPETAPQAYATWLHHVSQPITLLPAHSVSRTDLSAKSYSYPTWSGLEAHNTKTRQYDAVQGEWLVPDLDQGESNTTTYSSTWVGLDGDGPKDLVQAGTEQNYTEWLFFQATSYSTWTELLPNQATAQGTSLSINPSDDIEVAVWIGDPSGKMDIKGNTAWFSFADHTSGQGTTVHTPLSGTYFVGSDAEWIMERPTIPGQGPADLSDYVYLAMNNAYAVGVGGWHKCGRAANRLINMVNGTDWLSEANWYGQSSDYLSVTWINYH